jgi:hypothetical protein
LKGVDIASELENASLVAAAPVGASAPAEKKAEEAPKEEEKAPLQKDCLLFSVKLFFKREAILLHFS